MKTKQGAVFFDRDDTLIHDTGYMFKISDFQWLKGATESLCALSAASIPIFIVTNQGGIGKGLFTLAQMHAFHDHLCSQASKAGSHITDIAYCPHHPEAVIAELKTPCKCRKPQAGLFFDLAEKWEINLAASVMIGDRLSDIQAGQNAGCTAWHLTPQTALTDLTAQAIMHIKGT